MPRSPGFVPWRPPGIRARAAAALGALLIAAASGAEAPAGRLRVGTAGDYAPFSSSGADGSLGGFDIAVARAYAQQRGLTLELVRFRWPELLEALEAGRFDVAMSGVTVRPGRSVAGRFSAPVAESGALLLLREPERWRAPADLDQPGVRIGVNAGGHLERVAREHFPRATLLSIEDNAAVREALLAEALDAAVTDSLEAPQWLRGAEQLGKTETFTRDRKAYLVRADRPELLADLDRWLLERERDGSLAQLRRQYFGVGGGGEPAAGFATPVGALFAAIDERLALMPWVGAAKRRAGLPLEVPEREALVLDAAVADARAAALRAGVAPLPESAVRAVFAAQLEAAKEVQWNALRDPAFVPEKPIPDLESQLRPALLRIGEHVAELLIALPPGLDPGALRSAARDGLRTPRLSPDSVAAIAEAVAKLSQAKAASARSDASHP